MATVAQDAHSATGMFAEFSIFQDYFGLAKLILPSSDKNAMLSVVADEEYEMFGSVSFSCWMTKPRLESSSSDGSELPFTEDGNPYDWMVRMSPENSSSSAYYSSKNPSPSSSSRKVMELGSTLRSSCGNMSGPGNGGGVSMIGNRRPSDNGCSKGRQVCVFCRNNGEAREFYTSHTLKDDRGNTVCPVLRAYTCPLCGAHGDTSHTIKYCPKYHPRSKDDRWYSSVVR